MQARFWLAPIALFLASLPKTILAQENPRIYLTPAQVVGEANGPAEPFDSALLSAVGDRPIMILTPATSSGAGNLSEAVAKLKEGQKLVEDSPDKAVDILKKVVDSYEASMAQVEDVEPYFQALSLLATAYLNGGYEDEYVEAVKKYSAMRLDGVPKGTNDEVADEISKAQAKAKKATPGTLKISSSEATYQVRVDGSEVTDKSISLPPGVHFVVVTAPGKNPFVEKVNVASSGSAQVSANLTSASDTSSTPTSIEKATTAPSKELIEFLKKGTLTPDARKLAVDLAKKNKADLVILNMVARDSGQYRAYIYALRAKDASVVELTQTSYKPGPAATLAKSADEVMGALVGVAYNFPKNKEIPAANPIKVEPKGAAPLVVNTPDNPTNPTNPNPNPNATKVDPYAVNVAALPTNTGDSTLTAPPDAMGGNKETPLVGSRPDNKNISSTSNKPEYSIFNPEKPKNGNTAANSDNGALDINSNNNTKPEKTREPYNLGALPSKPWFWPVVGAVGAGAAGTGAYFVFKPNGLDATITWP
jgi:hypothetical protein